jgi:monoamine oxidase
LAMGVLDRCILRFPTAFWGNTYTTFTLAGTDPHSWYQFIPLNGPLGIPALMAFNAGSRALALEAKTDAQLTAEMTQIVQNAFGVKAVSNGMVATRWGKDPFAYGSYSYVPLGGSFNARNVLATPVSNQLYFAGEAYTKNDPSTVHGAYNSGKATATAVLARLK